MYSFEMTVFIVFLSVRKNYTLLRQHYTDVLAINTVLRVFQTLNIINNIHNYNILI